MRPNPSRVSAFKNCFGTIWSVSTLTRSIGITRPECVMKGRIGDDPRFVKRYQTSDISDQESGTKNSGHQLRVSYWFLISDT
jgi:hypothetical protein